MMKTLTTLLAAALYLAAVTTAHATFLINSYSFGVTTPATVTFVGCTNLDTDTNEYNYTAHATGTAGTRKTIVGISGRDGATNFSVSAVAVGGVSATLAVDTSADTGSLVQSAIYIIDNPSGTTANIRVTYSESILTSAVCVWAAYDLLSETPTDTASGFNTSSAVISLNLDVSTDGFAVGSAAADASGSAATWSGMTEQADSQGGEAASYAAADTTTAGTPLTVEVDWSGTADATGVSASFR